MSRQDTPKSAAGTFYLILIQVISRGLTFIGNQALLRFLTPQHLGLAVQLEALSISILYTARESLRVALQRAPQSKAADETAKSKLLQGALNVAWLVVLLGFFLGAIFGTIYLQRTSTDVLQATHFEIAFWLYGAATIIELLSEPCFVIIQQNSLFKDRARAETLAAFARCIAACSTAIFMRHKDVQMSVLPFAIGQVFYGLILCAAYYWSTLTTAASSTFSVFPKRILDSSDTVFSRFPRPLLHLAGAFYGQSIFKWLLTQGDTLVLSLFADLQSQGIFALASNYGGLASRLLFQPIEESSRNIFGLLLSTGARATVSVTKASTSPEVAQKKQEAIDHLSTTLRLYMLGVAFPCVTLLPKVFPILVQTLLGTRSQWSSEQTSTLLSAYSYYLPCLAVNGVLDAFVTSAATEGELGAQSLMMIGVTMIYLSAAYFGMTVMKLGAVGLVYANFINMALRIAFSIWFVWVWTHSNLPKPNTRNQPSGFARFIRACLPSKSCIFAVAIIVLGMQVQDTAKIAAANTSQFSKLSQIRVNRLDLDLFDLTYITSAAILLFSSILLTEQDFLHPVVEPLLPGKVRALMKTYLPVRKVG